MAKSVKDWRSEGNHKRSRPTREGKALESKRWWSNKSSRRNEASRDKDVEK